VDREETLNLLAQHQSDLARLGVKSLAVFGSVARGEAHPDSDVDVLVEFSGRATFDGYMQLKFFLEGVLGRKVDLVTRRALKPRLAQRVERDALYVA
jgi:hypothetical protein